MVNRSPGTLSRRLAVDALTPLFVLLFVISVALSVFCLLYQPSYTVGDWLINYSDGFIRRGLPGQVFLVLAHVLRIPAPWIALLGSSLSYATFLTGMYLLARPLKRTWLLFALLFSPAALPFVVLNGLHVGYRKETLLLAALAVALLLLQKRVPDWLLGSYLVVALAVIVLSHEAMTVCLPYFFAAAAIGLGSMSRAFRVTAPAFLVAGLLVVVVSRHPGTEQAAEVICRSVGGQWSDPPAGEFPGMDWTHSSLCSGSIAWLTVPLSGYHQQSRGLEHRSYMFFGLRFALACVPLVCALWWMYRKDQLRREVHLMLAAASVSFLGSLGLFYSTLDWGRWFYMQNVCLLLLIVMTAQKAPSFLPAPGRKDVPATSGWMRFAAPILTLLFCTCWTLPVHNLTASRYGYLDALRFTRRDMRYRVQRNADLQLGAYGEPTIPSP